MKNLPIKLLTLIMLLSMIVSPVMAMDLQADSGTLSAQEIEPLTRPEPELVPEEIQDLFEDGMSIEDFLVWNKGPIPNAVAEYADIPLTVIVQLERPGLIAMKQRPDRDMGFDDADYVGQLAAAQDGVIKEVKAISADIAVMGQYTKVLNGFMAHVTAKDLADIRALPGVKSVTRAPEHTVNLANSVPLTKSDLVWAMGDTGYTGEDITIAVIDSGIDYTHAMFGTLGDPDAYALNDPNVIEPGTFPTPKVIGGWDFAGTDYDASGTYGPPVPVPDPDPLDEGGHGTHVASTAAGIDVGFGSGVAPDAKLYALKVFGAQGSTNLVVDAIEWAVDPNGDGYIDDHVDVINMSLGSSFGPSDETDPEYQAIEAANLIGVFVVASAGNAGDQSYVTGSPGNTDSVLAVAASTTGYMTSPYISYNDGADKIPYTTSYNPFLTKITAEMVDVVDYGNASGELCDITGVSSMTGKIALIKRGSCSFAQKINNAEVLGAVAAIIYNNIAGTISMDTTGSTLPAGSILKSDGELLKSRTPLLVSVGPDSNVTTFVSDTPPDSIASFSSRGPRGYDSMLKPDITAPGQAIFAAQMGTGDLGMSMSGTSMASPHVAGVAALMKQAHPTWSNEQIKAALMNTAVDLADPVSAEVPRQGAGRVDALAAVTTDVVAVADSKFVSMNWGVIEVTEETYTGTKSVALRNFSDSEVTLDVAAMFTSAADGATLTPEISELTIPAFGKASVDFTLDIDTTLLPIGFMQMEEYYGYVTFSGDGANLRVPFYFVPRPYTEITEVDSYTDIELEDMGWIDLEQTGPIASSLWGYPVTMVSDNDPSVIDLADLRYVGMDFGWADPTYGDILIPSFAMWDDQHTLQPYWSEVDLYVYGDAPAPVVNFNYNYSAGILGGYPDNTWVVLQVDFNDGKLYLASPYLIYTDYNSGFQEWYLPAAYQYITDEFDYEVVSFDWYGTSDYAGMASFDITKPPFLWGVTDMNPWLSEFSLLFMVNDANGLDISQPEGIMLVDYFGKPGVGQAYFWPVAVKGNPLKINEFVFDHSGTDYYEFVEIFGMPSTDYSRYSILQLEGNNPSAFGVINSVDAVGTTDENGIWWTGFFNNRYQNDSPTFLLVKDFEGEVGDDLDTDDDGVIDVEPWSILVDSIAVNESSSHKTYATTELFWEYDGLPYTPGGASRIPDGYDTESITDWVRNDWNLAGIPGETGTPTFGEAYNTPGELNRVVPFTSIYLPLILNNYIAPTTARMQVAHLAPFADTLEGTRVDISLNGEPVAALQDVDYGDSTAYIELPKGSYLVEIFPDDSETAAISETVALVGGMDYTAIAIGGANNQALNLRLLEDDNTAPAAGKFKLRLGHLAPFAEDPNTTADVRLDDGTPILEEVNFGDVADYLELDAGTYDLKITTPGGDTTLINLAPVTFAEGDIVSAFAVGDGDNQDLGGFALPAGEPGFFLPLEARLQVAHLAPFADPGTVDIFLNGGLALDDVNYGDSTAYIELVEGSYLVEIVPDGATDPAISETVDLVGGNDYTAIAVGDITNQPLDLLVLLDDNTAPTAGNFKLRLGHLAPFAEDPNTTADVRLDDGTPVLENIDFGDVADYVELAAGEYDLKITTPGGGTTLINLAPVSFAEGDIVSAFAVGDGTVQDLGGFALPADAVGFFLPLEARLQVAHLAPFADPGTVDIFLNGGLALDDVNYGDSTAYIELVEGSYLVEIVPDGATDPAISETVELVGGNDYTAIAVGDITNQPLDLLVLLDDNTAPTAGNFKLRLGHLAPFADTLAGTTADVRLDDDTVILDDVQFGAVTDYLALPVGEYDLKITSPDGTTTLIDFAPVDFTEGQIISVFAVGNITIQPLGGFALPSGAVGGFLTLE